MVWRPLYLESGLRRFLLLSMTAILASACFEQEVPARTLSELLHPEGAVYVHQDLTADLILRDDFECFRFDGSATLNGAPLEKLSSGGALTGVGVGKGGVPGTTKDCYPADWRIPAPLPDAPTSELTISDATATFRFSVENFGATHAFAPPAGPVALRWGEPTTLEWSNTTDQPCVCDISVTLDGGDQQLSMVDPSNLDRFPSYDAGTYQFYVFGSAPDGGTPAFPNAEILVQTNSPGLGVECPAAQAFCPFAQLDFIVAQRFPAALQ